MCVQTLAGEFYTDALQIGSDSKLVIELTCGAWIVELSELAGLRGRDVEHVKHFLSRQSDRARLSYDRITTDRSRQFIVIATTNEDRFLRDATGNRRFWPVSVGEIDIDALARDRDQLWAEAAHYEKQGEPLELPRQLWADAAASQAKRTVVDPWFDLLHDALGDRRRHVAINDLWRFLRIEAGRQNPPTARRLNDVMTQLGFERTRRRRNGQPERAFTNQPDGDWIDVK
jgi:predicted P-loop ATPase